MSATGVERSIQATGAAEVGVVSVGFMARLFAVLLVAGSAIVQGFHVQNNKAIRIASEVNLHCSLKLRDVGI